MTRTIVTTFSTLQAGKSEKAIGLRRVAESLCAFGLRVVPVAELQASCAAALVSGQHKQVCFAAPSSQPLYALW